MSSNAVDYFATLGRKRGELSCELLRPAGADCDDHTKNVHPSTVWKNAIVDIDVIYKDDGDTVRDSSWELIELTIDDTSANCLCGVSELGSVFIAIKRRNDDSSRLDHICDIIVLYQGETVPDGYEAIEKSISGESFFDNGSSIPRSFLAIRRSEPNETTLMYGASLIDDICIVNKTLNEFEPEAYNLIDRYLQQPKHWGGHNLQLAFHKREPMGLCDIRFNSATLDRFPSNDHEGLALPVDELPMFVFPHGMRLKCCTKQNFPLPDFFTFVFTDVHGRHLYTTCLRFYEVVPKEEVCKLFKSVYANGNVLASYDDKDVFSPKVICVVSQYPFYRAMGRFLKQLYSLSLSPSFFPIEHFIASVVSQVPVPIQGGRPFYVVLDAALISHSSRSMQAIKFELPPKCFFPAMDLDFSGPMRCLSLDRLLAIFSLLLRESKVIFTCASNALLTDVMETFRSLLFPLTWSSCFVTRLPDVLSGLLQAPGGFLIGIHMLKSASSVGIKKSKVLDDNIGSVDDDLSWTRCLQAGTYIVDLSEDKICYFDGNGIEDLSSNRVMSMLRALPSGPLGKLQKQLSAIAKLFRLCPQDVRHAQFDSAFEFQSFDADALPVGVSWSEFPTLKVRDSFLCFMADVLGDYSKYVLSSVSKSGIPTFREIFSFEEYQRDADKSVKPLLESLTCTQMFANLVQERLEVASYSLLFFDKAVKRLKELNISSLAADHRHNPKYHQQSNTGSVAETIPLYEHVSKMDVCESCNSLQSNFDGGERHEVIAASRDEYLGSIINFEHALSLDDRSDSRDMTVGKENDRHELLNPSDLGLSDFARGPLIIPGPLLSEMNIDRDGDEPTEREYIYDASWPSFDHGLVKEVINDPVRQELHKIVEKRKRAIEMKSDLCQYFSREEPERNSYKICRRFLYALRSPIYYDAKDSALLASITPGKKAALAVAVGLFNVSLTLLSTRSICRPGVCHDHMQILGLLAHLDSINLLYQLDEATWRSLIISCNCLEDGFLKEKLSKLLLSLMRCFGLNSNIITSICCTKNMICNCQLGSDAGSGGFVLDPFCHLEEIGLAWFAQKTIPYDDNISKSRSNSIVSYYDSGPKSFQTSSKQGVTQSPIRRFSSIFKRSSAENPTHRKVRRKSVKASKASTRIAQSMRLNRKSSYLSSYKPSFTSLLHVVPQVVSCDLLDPFDCKVVLNFNSKIDESKVEEMRQRCEEADQEIGPAPDDRLEKTLQVDFHQAFVMNVREDYDIKLDSLYALIWTSSFEKTPTKTAPGIDASLGAPESEEELCESEVLSSRFSVLVSSKENNPELLFVEFFGDMIKKSDKTISFDQSLGVGRSKISLSHNERRCLGMKLQSPSGEISVFAKMSAKYVEMSDDMSRKVEEDDNVSHERDRSPKSENPKKSWKERLSFGFYKNKAEKDDNEAPAPTVSPPSTPVANTNLTDLESIKRIGELGDDGDFSDDESTNKSIDQSLSNEIPDLTLANDVHSDVLRAIENSSKIVFENCKGVIGIYSYTPCEACGYCFLDDEIMACWAGFSTKSLNKPEGVDGPAQNDIYQSHIICCERCESDIVPLLHIQQYESCIAEDEMCVAEQITVPHISPEGLRYLLESALMHNGIEVLQSSFLLTNHPQLYWNLMWYCTILDIPSGLLPESSPINSSSNDRTSENTSLRCFYGPIVVSWRECVVRAKVKHVLDSEPIQLSAADLFPGALEEELDAGHQIIASLDKSPECMAEAIVQFSKLKSLTDSFHDCPARSFYLAFYSLIHFLNPPILLDFKPRDIFQDLAKGAVFDNVFQEAIAGDHARNFGSSGFTGAEIIKASSSSCALAIRLLIGFLF